MSVLVGNPFLLNSAAGGPYQISRSLRFNSADSAYLSRTPGSAGNRKTWTWAAWVKRTVKNTATDQMLFAGGTTNSATGFLALDFNSSDKLRLSSATANILITTAVYRDAAAWAHVLLAFDSTQGTDANKAKLYVNGVEVTAFDTDGRSSISNQDYGINQAAAHEIGRATLGSNKYLDGYLADIHFIDGQALTPSSFTETDANGVLQPKAYTGSYGTNGFKLTFSDNSTAAALGTDTSGNGNTWTVNNLSNASGGPTSVASASGALPIYNTTDTYGATKGTGTRTDASSSSIALAVAMDGANNGTTFTDESATIKGSGSAKSITRTGAITSTAQSKYYGSSGYFDGSSSLGVGSSSDFNFTGNFTWEFWIRPAAGVGTHSRVIEFSNTLWAVYIYSSANNLAVYGQLGSQYILAYNAYTPDSWTHIAITKSGGTAYLFSNGVLVATAANSQSVSGPLSLTINGDSGGSYRWQGYIQDVRIYSGVAKYTSNFNPPSSTQNPTVAVGNDSLVDSPTNYGTDDGLGGSVRGNYATLNPLNISNGTGTSSLGLTNGNLDFNAPAETYRAYTTSTQTIEGKTYWELRVNTYNTSYTQIGISPTDEYNAANGNINLGNHGSNSVGWEVTNGAVRKNGSVVYTTTVPSLGSVIGMALDPSTGQVFCWVNGVAQNSGNAVTTVSTGKSYYVTVLEVFASSVNSINFGQRPFAYTAPSGFKALCTQNLPAPVIAQPSTAMDVKLYTGNGSSQSITGLGFSPDFVWIKDRSQANGHGLFDVIRGATKGLFSNLTNAEITDSNSLTSFDATGFSTGSGGTTFSTNINGNSYVGWAWDAGSSTVSNPDGSISSQVRANASAGFSIVSWTSTSSSATIGHGLGVEPYLIITKGRSGTDQWVTYHKSVGATKYLYLNATDAAATYSGFWNDTAPTSTVFTTGTDAIFTTNGRTKIAYCFAPVAGYSSAFSFTGNGSSDGPMVWLGFRPRFLIIKRTDAAYGWYMYDTARDTYNIAGKELLANASDAEVSDSDIDILSNGFKPRRSSLAFNASGGTFVGFAWAESPFQYARAR